MFTITPSRLIVSFGEADGLDSAFVSTFFSASGKYRLPNSPSGLNTIYLCTQSSNLRQGIEICVKINPITSGASAGS